MSRDRRMALAAVECALSDGRGGDSWGYYDIINDRIHKGLDNLANVSTKVGKCLYFMGHTRKATTGSVIADNSHPFTIGNIIGSHNGMILNHEELNEKYDRQCIVDSEHIFHHINSGLDLDDINGYGAIEWVDKANPSRVYLCKLDGGELSVYRIGSKNKNNRGVIWSSDENHLLAALSAADITEFSEFKIKTGVVYYVQNGVFYETTKEYSLGDYSWGGYSRNEYGWWTKDTAVSASGENIELAADKMDERHEVRWNELWDRAEQRALALSQGGYWNGEESSTDEEFRHTHELNGDNTKGEPQEDIDEAMKEWYASCGGDPADFNSQDYHPSVIKEIVPTK